MIIDCHTHIVPPEFVAEREKLARACRWFGLLYGNPERVWQVQEETAGMANRALQFTRLPWVAGALWPLGRLPYVAAYAVFQALSLAALAALPRAVAQAHLQHHDF